MVVERFGLDGVRPRKLEEGRQNLGLTPAPLPPPFRIGGALEAEDLDILAASEGMPLGVQDMSGFARDRGGGMSWAGEGSSLTRPRPWAMARETSRASLPSLL